MKAWSALSPGRTGLIVILTIAVGIGAYVSLRDLAGWVILALTFVLVELDPGLRNDRHLKYTIWLVIAGHHAVALGYVFAPQHLPVVLDAETFHRGAVLWTTEGRPKIGIGADFYRTMLSYGYRLGGYYRLDGESLLLGKELSILAFTLSTLLLVRFFDLLGIRAFNKTIVCIYGLAPALLLYTSITMREAWIVLFLMGALYCGIRFTRSAGISWFAGLTATACAMGMMHKGLIVAAVFMLGFFVVAATWVRRDQARSLLIAGIVITVAMTMAVVTMARYDVRGSGVVRAILAGRTLDFIGESRQLIADARSAFKVSLDTSSYPALAKTLPPVYAHYLFAPFPWQVSTAKDGYAALESTLRLILMLATLLAWRRASGPARGAIGVLILMYVAITLLWALGTTNYGQALRHHVVTNWVLLVTGLPYLLTRVQRGFAPGNAHD